MKFGNTKIGGMSLGSTKIGGANFGSTPVFREGESPTPPTPTPVFYDRLVFDGVAKIQTDIILPALCSMRVVLENEKNKAAQRIFHAVGGNGLIQLIYGSSTSSTQRRLQVYYDSTTSGGNWGLNFSYTCYFFMTPTKYGSYQTVQTHTSGSAHPTDGLVLGGWDSGNPFSGDMGTFFLYDSSAQNAADWVALENNFTPVATLRPCTYNGEAGFWYVEGNKFFGNTAGSGTLTVRNNA